MIHNFMSFMKGRLAQFLIGLLLGPVGGYLTYWAVFVTGVRGILLTTAFVVGYVGFVVLALRAPTGRLAGAWLLVANGLILLAMPFLAALGPRDNMAYIAVYYGVLIAIIFVMVGFIVKGPRKPWW